MPRCKACGSPIRYAAEDHRRRFPLDTDGKGHVCRTVREALEAALREGA